MGILKIHHLNCTTLNVRFARVFDGKRGIFDDELVCITHCLLVETSDAGLVLVDAGFSTQEVNDPRRISPMFRFMFRPPGRREETAVAYIEALGLTPQDVRHIILTHLDYDHAAGISDFPWATVHVYAPELNAVRLSRSWRNPLRYNREQLSQHEHWESYDDNGSNTWYGFRKLRLNNGLGDEFALVPLVGHSVGHCGVAIRRKRGWLLHAGDAYMNHAELQPAPNGPASTGLFQPVMQDDGKARKNSLHLLSELHRCHGDEVRIFCAHDKVEFDQLVKTAGKEAHFDV